MEKIQIVYPMMAMFFLSSGLLLSLGLSRFMAIQTGKASIKYYQTYDEGCQPKWLHLLGRHVQNHFEVPPLFHICALLFLVTDSVSALAVYLAWGFVILRCAHTLIHLTINNVSYRFFCFGLSLMTLGAMWIVLLLALVNAP